MSPAYYNTAIVVITYNPDYNFINNLIIHHTIAKFVIVVDNGSSNINNWLPSISPNTFVIKSVVNRGIAWGLNTGIKQAWKFGVKYVLTFDQDSTPCQNILQLYAKHICGDTGLIGTTYALKTKNVNEITVENKLTLITSGCLHPLSTWLKVGEYNETLFIDSVDFDYALRTRLNGLSVLRSSQPLISHHLGNPVTKYGMESSNHSTLRRYYMARNHIYITKHYFLKKPIFILKKNYTFLKECILMILVENHRNDKIKAILKGIIDGIQF